MSDLITRARLAFETASDNPLKRALLAALDPEDQALVEIMARAAVVELAEGMPAPKTLHKLDVAAARASLVALRDSILAASGGCSEMTAYDFPRDQERMALNHSLGNHKAEEPWQVYRNGYRLGGFATFQDACEWASKEEIMGDCMIANPFEPPPSLGPLFGAGYEAGFHAGPREEET